MKEFHHVTIRVFVKEYEGDDKQKALDVFPKVVPLDFEKEKIAVRETVTYRHDKKTPIYILELQLRKKKHIDALWDHVFGQLDKEDIADLQDSFIVDDECYFFLRLDYPLLEEGKYVLTRSGDCFHIRALVAAYPANEENGRKIITEFLKKYA